MVLRKRGVALHKQGKSQTFIAGLVGVSQSTVSYWLKAYRSSGDASLQYPEVGGSSRRISTEQQDKLAELLKQGAAVPAGKHLVLRASFGPGAGWER